MLMKRDDFDFVFSIDGAFDILLSKEPVDVQELNKVLFYCINPFVKSYYNLRKYKCYSVVEYLNNCYEHIYDGFSIEKQQTKICKMTIDLLNVLKKCGCKDLPYNRCQLREFIRYDSIPLVKRLEGQSHNRFGNDYYYVNSKRKFDFDIYRLVKNASDISEMGGAEGYDTKIILLWCYLTNLMDDIFKTIYATLDKFDIVDLKYLDKIDVYGYSKQIEQLYSICRSDKKHHIQTIQDIDKMKLMVQYHLPSKDIEDLFNILDDVKDSLIINPILCNRKKFSAIVYILYRSQGYLNIKKGKLSKYTDFKKVMCMYYDMPFADTYKPNKIKELAREIKNIYPCFDKFVIDEKYKSEFDWI